MTAKIASTATEYRYLPIRVAPVDGVYPALTAAAVQWRITGPGHPPDGTLVAVDTLIAGDEGEWFAGVLIGSGALVLAKGTHHVTARVSDAPESAEPLPAQRLLVQ